MNVTDAHTLRVLEWEALTELLAGYASTPWGARELRQLRPRNDAATYRRELVDVAELLRLIEAGDSLPLRSVDAIETHLDEAAVRGAHLDGERLLQVADFFAMVENLAGAADRHRAAAPRLSDRLGALTPAPEFRKKVEKSFLPDGSLADGASPRLRELRRRIQKLQSNILERLQKQAAALGGDSVVTMREGRYVISVTEHERAKVQGIVHDRSQSGTTYFVEPVAMLEIGNDLRSAEADLRDEIVRILSELTTALRSVVGSARANIDLVRDIDAAWGKARWAARYRARLPRTDDDSTLTLAGARHPLLLAQKFGEAADAEEAFRAVVPISLSLTGDCCGVIISGPNTGGKTVALKTTGLAVLMVQAGLPIVADGESSVGIFDAVFADIGDEQSLALSLSTFSAHLKQVGASCRQATSRSLVLLDELGVGTDPGEGAALAAAVILALVERGTKLVVTTHYSVLKTLSERDGRIQNAAFLFDETRLAPTYQLVLGRPGASYALEIARRLDFPDDVVTRAEAGVGQQARELAALLTRLSEEERLALEAKAERELESSRLAALLEYNRGEQDKWRRLERKAEKEIARQVEAAVVEARRETERVIAELRRAQAAPDAIRNAHAALAKLRDQHQASPETGGVAGALRIGQKVRIAGIGQVAEVTQILQDGERVQVQIGSVHYTVDRGAVTEALEEEPTAEGSPPGPRGARPPADEPATPGLLEVDLRGRAADEAMLELEEVLEAADRQGYRELRVIHGRGTGVLRRELGRWLKKHPRVKSTRLGGRGEGGDGVTVVELTS